MSHKRGFRNDINYTNFITKMIYDLVYEKQMFWVKIHGLEVYKLYPNYFDSVIHFTIQIFYKKKQDF
ncbi:hypothetical protein HanIR_Chr05g0226231 [Helianthus annuus]|nr:hypothetical protein HanIR_Chr05g0226231 [Helianthus annuus]